MKISDPITLIKKIARNSKCKIAIFQLFKFLLPVNISRPEVEDEKLRVLNCNFSNGTEWPVIGKSEKFGIRVVGKIEKLESFKLKIYCQILVFNARSRS